MYRCIGLILAVACALPIGAAASGTARIEQSDGAVRIYKNVHIRVENKQMFLTSADGVGTFVIERAGCTAIEGLLRCHPYQAVLKQHGRTLPVNIRDGTAWFNPTSQTQTLPLSSTRLPPNGVLMSMSTAKGSYLSLIGIVDRVKK